MPNNRQLTADYQKCEEIIIKSSKTFYKAFSQIENPSQRNAIYAVYAFCRIADDLIDEEQNLPGLENLEKELYEFENGKPINHFMWRALGDTKAKFYHTPEAFEAFHLMIKGQKMDLTNKRYSTTSDLLTYCYHVATSVGLMLLPVLAPNNYQELVPFAVDLGYAMQITNILRDIYEDYLMDRVYLPQELLSKHQYSINDIKNKTINQNLINLFEELAAMAEKYYQNALNLLIQFQKDVQKPLLASMVLYRAILDEIRKHNYDVFSARVYVPDKEKIRLLKVYLQGEKL